MRTWLVRGMATVTGVGIAMLATTGSSAAGTTLRFAGYDWSVKSSAGQVGPGPNYFSPGNAWVDAEGRLHLRIVRSKGRWTCGEVVGLRSFGHGTYRFTLDTPVDALDPNVVLGLFTWSDDPAYAHREIDVEFSQWGYPANQNAQYVVQPYDTPGNMVRFSMPAGVPVSSHSFSWSPEQVLFRSTAGLDEPGSATPVLQEQAYTGPGMPVPGDETPRMNLWLMNGRAPLNGKGAEVVVRSFSFEPLP